MRNYIKFLGAPERFHDFLDEFQSESDRAAAVLGAAYLDEALGELIEASLAKDTNAKDLLGSMKPLGSFSARTTAAQGFGLITKAERQDLDLVRKIRNDFAHRVTGLSFMDSSVADRCDAFQCTEERFGALDGLRDAFPNDSRSLFGLAVGLLAYYLERRVEFAKRAEAANPPLWEFPSESREDAPVDLADDS